MEALACKIWDTEALAWKRLLSLTYTPEGEVDTICVANMDKGEGFGKGVFAARDAAHLKVIRYSGHKDANGRKLFEGDLIQSTFGRGEVGFDETSATFYYQFGLDREALWYHAGKALWIGSVFDEISKED